MQDKANFGPGPWMDEPDRLEWEYKGYKCLIKRAMNIGTLCGYVRVPKDHPLYDSDEDLEDKIDVHGGITWSKKDDELPDMWRIGFDCAHAGDYMPFLEKSSITNNCQYRDIAYVKAEVEKLADQCDLIAKESENG